MSRLSSLFVRKPQHVLNVYFTAGYPNRDDTGLILHGLQQAGVDLVEIGIPCSDPFADGETIQHSHKQALQNGMTLRLLFEQLAECRPQIHMPIVLMGYMNTIMQYGVDEFCRTCRDVGVEGVIIADLPFVVYEQLFKPTFDQYELAFIPLITPLSSEPLIRRIDQTTNGFIYMVSSVGTTGSTTGITPDMLAYFKRIEEMRLRSPRLIGFGIKDQATFETACRYANGAIIGSAFVRALANESQTPLDSLYAFVDLIRPQHEVYGILASLQHDVAEYKPF